MIFLSVRSPNFSYYEEKIIIKDKILENKLREILFKNRDKIVIKNQYNMTIGNSYNKTYLIEFETFDFKKDDFLEIFENHNPVFIYLKELFLRAEKSCDNRNKNKIFFCIGLEIVYKLFIKVNKQGTLFGL